jgi:hypothetical protein
MHSVDTSVANRRPLCPPPCYTRSPTTLSTLKPSSWTRELTQNPMEYMYSQLTEHFLFSTESSSQLPPHNSGLLSLHKSFRPLSAASPFPLMSFHSLLRSHKHSRCSKDIFYPITYTWKWNSLAYTHILFYSMPHWHYFDYCISLSIISMTLDGVSFINIITSISSRCIHTQENSKCLSWISGDVS